MPHLKLAELFLLGLFTLGAILVGVLVYRIWAFWQKSLADHARTTSFLQDTVVDDPMKADGWAFEGHPRDAWRSLRWMGAGFGLVIAAAILALLVGLAGGGPVGAFIGIVFGPIMGGVMFLGGFAMMPITAVRFRMYGWFSLWLGIVMIAYGGIVGVSYLISEKIWPFR